MQTVERIIDPLLEEVLKFVQYSNDEAYFFDPLLSINRTRINAEICKTLIKVDYSQHKNIIEALIHWLLNNQNCDGSWNEEHPNYNKPSAFITAIVGETLLEYRIASKRKEIDTAIQKGYHHIKSQEFKPGYFKKSINNYTDCLNINATCGSFLALYGTIMDDKDALESARNAAHQVCYHQYANGAYPYTPHERGFPYKYHLDVPCIHYQGVTLFYLQKIYENLQEDWLGESILRGVEWLASVQKKDGSFDWSKSGLMFAYYLSGAYAFAYASFRYASRWDQKYESNAEKSLMILEKNIRGYLLRWEYSSLIGFFIPKFVTLRSAFLGDYPLRHRLFRIGYAYYHQFSRRRISADINEKTFLFLCSLYNIDSSTVEPTKNFPDLFMTSEALDCLSTARCWSNK